MRTGSRLHHITVRASVAPIAGRRPPLGRCILGLHLSYCSFWFHVSIAAPKIRTTKISSRCPLLPLGRGERQGHSQVDSIASRFAHRRSRLSAALIATPANKPAGHVLLRWCFLEPVECCFTPADYGERPRPPKRFAAVAGELLKGQSPSTHLC
jgi:hypothetical protein